MSFYDSVCVKGKYSCLGVLFFLIHQIYNYMISDPEASQQNLPEEKAQNV